MTLSQEQHDMLMVCGRFSFPASKCILQLEIKPEQQKEFQLLFADHNSELRQLYETGKIKTEFEIMEALETKVKAAEEGSDEAAKTLHHMRKNQQIDDLISKYEGV